MKSSFTYSAPLSIVFDSAEEAVHFPVFTFSSGPTNSMRGAAYLSGLSDAIVVDVGGTTTDIGVLKNGFPREASSQRKVRKSTDNKTLIASV